MFGPETVSDCRNSCGVGAKLGCYLLGGLRSAWESIVNKEVDGADLEDGEAAQEVTSPLVPVIHYR